MRRAFTAAAAVAGAIMLSGCSAELPDGYREFTAAREKYETLDSAKVTMRDLDSGEQVMEFSFYISANDEMVLSYTGTWGGVTQQAYSDGAEFFYKESGDDKWTVIGSGDENYIYNVYNRKYRYPYAEGRMFFLAAEAVKDAAVSKTSPPLPYQSQVVSPFVMVWLSSPLAFSVSARIHAPSTETVLRSTPLPPV